MQFAPKDGALTGHTPAAHSQRCGMTLVEIIFALSILALLSVSLAKALTDTKFLAEDNLYEATALTVAISTIEQMKGTSITKLSSPDTSDGKPIFALVVGGGSIVDLFLDEENTLSVPIVTDENGVSDKTLDLTIIPSITSASSTAGYWLEVIYSWDHPRTGRSRTEVVRNMRSTVPTF